MCSEVTSTLRETVRCCHRVCHPGRRLVTRQLHALPVVSRCRLANLCRADQLCINTLLLLHLHVRAQRFSSLHIRHNDHARSKKATIAPNQATKMLETGETVPC